MIYRLRTIHRRVWTALFFALPVLFAVVILARQPRPLIVRLPAALTAAPARPETASETPEREWTGLWGELPITTRLYASSPKLELETATALGIPDLLLYWSPITTSNDSLSDRAVLLGDWQGVGNGRYALPPEAASTSGQLVLYSLAHREVVARTEWPPPTPDAEPSDEEPAP